MTFELSMDLVRGTKGSEVRLVQEWLSLHECGTAIDGDYGPATERAVRRFQNTCELEESGCVDQATFDALLAPMQRAVAPIDAGEMSLGALVVAYARQHLKERPREIGGQNRGPWVRLYMNGNEGDPWAWCAGFACSMLRAAAESKNVEMPLLASFSCDVLAMSAKQRGLFVAETERNGENVAPGSFFLVRRTSTDWTHVGIVTAFDAETMDTIEGNTNDEGSREGYEVCARTRGYAAKDFIAIG